MTQVFIVSILAFILSACFTKFAQILFGKYHSPIKEELKDTQAKKEGISHFGGIAFVLSFIISLLFLHGRDVRIIAILIPVVLFYLVGLMDDLKKIQDNSSDGLTSLRKLFLQALASLVAVITIVELGLTDTTIFNFDLGYFYYPLAVFVSLVFLNGVNITDGLDGLAIKTSIPVFIFFTIISLILGINSELVFSSSTIIIFSLLGFLWFNSKPATIFMGDGGSHAIGGLLAMFALITSSEVSSLVAAGVFIIELGTSFIQIFSIRVFKKKVFSIAPIHHAFEKKGIKEEKITERAQITSVICCALAAIMFLVYRG